MPITLESTDYDAINDFRVAAGENLLWGENLVQGLRLEMDRSSLPVLKDTHLWPVALARAKAFVDIAVLHPAIVCNIESHHADASALLSVFGQASVLVRKSADNVPFAVEIEVLRQKVCTLLYGEGQD